MSRSTFLKLLLPLAALAGFVAAYQPRQTFTVDLASASANKFLDNFHAPERGYHWSQARSAVWLSGLGSGNQAWKLGVRLSGSRPAGKAAPRVTLSVNGQPLTEFVASNEPRDYEFMLAPNRLGVNGDLLLGIDSDTFSPDNDPRELGLRVMRVWAMPAEGFALPSAKVFIFLIGIALACLVIAQRLHSPSAIFKPQALLIILCTISAVALVINRLEAAWWIGIVCLSLIGLALLIALIAWIVPRDRLSARQWHALLMLFALAALVRLSLDTGQGYEGDVAIYLSLAWKTVTLGIHSAYLNVSAVPPPNTPPLLLYPFWLMGWLYQQIFSPLFPPTWLSDPPILRFMLRLPSLLADLLSGAIIFRVTTTMQQPAVSARTGFYAASLYLFNPAVIFDSAYWGQTAALHTLWMLLAVVAAARSAFGWSGGALALAVLTKPQALAIAPVIVFVMWRERGFLRFTLAAVGTWLGVNAPFILTGNLASVLMQYAQTAQYHPLISVNAHNLWWFATGGQGWQPDSLPLGPMTFRMAGLLLFGLATGLSFAVLWRERRALYFAAAYQSLAFFMLLTQIHENHLLPMFAPLAVACVLDRKLWWLYGALTLTALMNMALHDPNLVAFLGQPAEEIYGGPALALPRWINAAIQTVLFGLFTAKMLASIWQTMGRGKNEEWTCVHS